MNLPHQDRKSRAMICEGANDWHVACHLLKKRDVSANDIDVLQAGSVEQALSSISVKLKEPGLNRLAIVLDADDAPLQRYNSAAATLKEAGFSPPAALPPDGLILQSTIGRTVGLWLMPNCSDRGNLEGFVTTLVPPCELWNFACRSTTESKLHGAAFPPQAEPKAQLYALLAWARDPGSPFGRAIAQGTLSCHSPLADAFCEWLIKCLDL